MPRKGFTPDWVSSPGDTMADITEERHLSLNEFADRMGHTPTYIRELLRGRAMITIETAQRLESVLGGTAAFWMIRESQFREDIIRIESADPAMEGPRWLSELPLTDLIKFGWLKPFQRSVDEVAACLRFFGVADVKAWRREYRDALQTAAFRTSPSFTSQPGALAAWLRQGEIESTSIHCKRWNAERFQEVLLRVRAVTRERDPRLFIPRLRELSAECGVAVVVLRAPTGCRASGATRFLSQGKALLMLSFRYLSDDHFWFTFFHEAGHLLLHDKTVLYLEGAESESTKEEQEANEFSSRLLIPPEFQEAFMQLPLDGRQVMRFAKRVGVSPGIVVGQLQHHNRITQRQLNNLKQRFKWSED